MNDIYVNLILKDSIDDLFQRTKKEVREECANEICIDCDERDEGCAGNKTCPEFRNAVMAETIYRLNLKSMLN